jgi:5-carboxymethyl-2-hydroxymuconate isomerase
MPSVLIEVRRPLSEQAGADIIEAVHGALRGAFKIPANDRSIRLVVHEPHRFECPPDRERPELHTHVSLDVFAGRSLEAKRSLYQGIVENLEFLGIPGDHVMILLREIPSRCPRASAASAARRAGTASGRCRARSDASVPNTPEPIRTRIRRPRCATHRLLRSGSYGRRHSPSADRARRAMRRDRAVPPLARRCSASVTARRMSLK